MKFALASLLTLSLAALPSLAAPTPAPAGHLSSLELESYCQPKQGQIGTLFVIEYEDGVVDTIPADKCFSLHSPDGAAPSVIRSCQKAICYLDSVEGCKGGQIYDEPKEVGPDFILRGDGPILHQFGTSVRCRGRD